MATKKKPENKGIVQLEQDLVAEKYGRLYLLYGEEIFLREEYFFRLKKSVLPLGAETFNLQELDGKELTLLQFEEAMDCLPMMAERTLVIVTDWNIYKLADDQKKNLMELLAQIPDYCTVVFYYDIVEFKRDTRTKLDGVLAEYGILVEFLRQEQEQLVKWVQHRFHSLGKEISFREATEFIFYCGDYMTKLASEIEKIAAYASECQVKKEEIYAVATPHLDAVVFEMTNALGEKNYDVALGVLSKLYQMQEHPLRILKVVSRQIRQIYGAKVGQMQGRGEDYVVKLWKMHPYAGKKITQSARRVSIEWCRNACVACALADRGMKSGGDGEELLTQLVLELAHGGQ